MPIKVKYAMGEKKTACQSQWTGFCNLVVREDWFGPVGLHSNFGCNGTESVKNNKKPAGTLLQDGNIFLQKKAKSKLHIMNITKTLDKIV